MRPLDPSKPWRERQLLGLLFCRLMWGQGLRLVHLWLVESW